MVTLMTIKKYKIAMILVIKKYNNISSHSDIVNFIPSWILEYDSKLYNKI